jgi:hypothetical protein
LGARTFGEYTGPLSPTGRPVTEGKVLFTSGDLKGWCYEGTFIKGGATGEGLLTRPDGSKKYEGEWRAGKFWGEGEHFDEDGLLV